MIDVKEKDELRFRGEIVDESINDGKIIAHYIKGDDTTNLWFEKYDDGKLYEIEVHYYGIDFYYDITESARDNYSCIKFMDDFMMEYVKNIGIFINEEHDAKKVEYSIHYSICEYEKSLEEADRQILYCRLITEDANKSSISKSVTLYGWREGFTTQEGIIEALSGLLEQAVNELYFKMPAKGFDTKPIDIVNHPSHYETGKFECIEVMQEALGLDAVKDFCLCNAFKYLYRNKRKNGLEDIKKAQWYINKYIELEESNE